MESFVNKWGWNNSPIIAKKRTSTLVSPDTKGNSKWIADQNIKYNTIKIIEENIGESHHIYG